MTTFQAIIYGIIHGFTEFLPVSSSAHEILVPYFLQWPEPSGVILGALYLGALLALLTYFRHDWASMISSFLQVIIFRKRPMTLDERLPIFIVIATIPAAAVTYYLKESLPEVASTPLWIAGGLAGFAVLLWLADSFSRKTKGMFNFNWLDSLLIGLGQIILLLPGGGRSTGAFAGALFRNYNREAAAKFTFFAAAPILITNTILNLRELNFHSSSPMPGMTWLSFWVALIVTFFAGLLAIGGLMKHLQRKGFGEYVLYRLVLAITTVVVVWIRSRSGS